MEITEICFSAVPSAGLTPRIVGNGRNGTFLLQGDWAAVLNHCSSLALLDIGVVILWNRLPAISV